MLVLRPGASCSRKLCSIQREPVALLSVSAGPLPHSMSGVVACETVDRGAHCKAGEVIPLVG
jgi:hypothetical protein